jgi:hypothetical protein
MRVHHVTQAGYLLCCMCFFGIKHALNRSRNDWLVAAIQTVYVVVLGGYAAGRRSRLHQPVIDQ